VQLVSCKKSRNLGAAAKSMADCSGNVNWICSRKTPVTNRRTADSGSASLG